MLPHILSPFAPYIITFRPISSHLKSDFTPYLLTFRPISSHLTPSRALYLSHFFDPKLIKRCLLNVLNNNRAEIWILKNFPL